ncbi:MAG: ABC transporter ATP-binding protein [Alphaproteobacteria bacterium]
MLETARESDRDTTATRPAPVLEVRDLVTRFATPEGEVCAVNDVSFTVVEGETVGIVGESGSGKSQVFMSVMGLLAANGWASGQVKYRGRDILGIPRQQLNRIRGSRISMIFQDPMTSLNPYLKVSKQLTEVLVQHKGMGEGEAMRRSVEMLDLVGIPEARRRITMYPHEFSGGMRQRVMIAMALLCEPDLLIADEPTTALDVTVQAQIIDLMRDLKTELNTAIVIITHDLGVIAGLSDRVMVMYAGQFVERGTVRDIFYDPQHPYTEGLLKSMPRIDEEDVEEELTSIPGQPPNLQNLPGGCSFRPRCPYAFDRCEAEEPSLARFAAARAKACHLDGLQAGVAIKGAATP